MTDDLISRQAVIDLFNRSDDFGWETSLIRRKIEKLPSVNPQGPKTGHWSHDGSHWKNRFICSGCGYKLFDEPTNYCPNCGAKMFEPQESEET